MGWDGMMGWDGVDWGRAGQGRTGHGKRKYDAVR